MATRWSKPSCSSAMESVSKTQWDHMKARAHILAGSAARSEAPPCWGRRDSMQSLSFSSLHCDMSLSELPEHCYLFLKNSCCLEDSHRVKRVTPARTSCFCIVGWMENSLRDRKSQLLLHLSVCLLGYAFHHLPLFTKCVTSCGRTDWIGLPVSAFPKRLWFSVHCDLRLH